MSELRPIEVLFALNRGEVIDLQGILFKKVEGEIRRGDTFIGVDYESANMVDYYVCLLRVGEIIDPKDGSRAFRRIRCAKVELVDDETVTADYIVPEECFR